MFGIKYPEIDYAKSVPAIFGKIKEFTPHVRELKLFDKEIEMRDEAERVNSVIRGFKESLDNPFYSMAS